MFKGRLGRLQRQCRHAFIALGGEARTSQLAEWCRPGLILLEGDKPRRCRSRAMLGRLAASGLRPRARPQGATCPGAVSSRTATPIPMTADSLRRCRWELRWRTFLPNSG
jgi:hypothetical protein